MSVIFYKYIDCNQAVSLFLAFDILVPVVVLFIALGTFGKNHSMAVKTISSGESIRVEIEKLEPISGEIQLKLPEGSKSFRVIDLSFGLLNAIKLGMKTSKEDDDERRKQMTRKYIGKSGDFFIGKEGNCSVLFVEDKVMKIDQLSLPRVDLESIKEEKQIRERRF